MQLILRHADDACIVVDKPSGLLSVPGRGAQHQDCAVARVQASFADALTVHRLDMATSGLMVLARGAQAQRTLSIAFERRQVHKRYEALVHGHLASDQGEVALPLLADWPNRPRQKVDLEHGKPSLTRYVVVHREPGRTRVQLEPVTGRAHQLRVHLLALGHPIIGDALYSSDQGDGSAGRMLLHATQLRFPHPRDGTALQVDSPAPF
jgi:tRNA pseudouridine32 synthase/23S rRNA pseudouridine746 synthase